MPQKSIAISTCLNSRMILKDKSPSCGVANCKQCNSTGIFATTIIKLKADLSMLQSNLLTQAGDLDSFIQK